MVESLYLWRKEVSKIKEKMLTMLRLVTEKEKTYSKTTTLHPK